MLLFLFESCYVPPFYICWGLNWHMQQLVYPSFQVCFTSKWLTNLKGKHQWLTWFLYFGSRYAITSMLVSSFFIVWKDLSCSLPHKNCWSLFVNFCNGSETSLKFGINFAQYVAILESFLPHVWLLTGKLFQWIQLWMGLERYPFLRIQIQNEMLRLVNSHLLLFSVRFTSIKSWKSALRALSWSSWVLTKVMTS